MKTFEGQCRGIGFTGQAYLCGDRFCVTAQLTIDGEPFDTIEDGGSVADCRNVPLRELAISLLKVRSKEEGNLIKEGIHPHSERLKPRLLTCEAQ